jgi:hypothetical protein
MRLVLGIVLLSLIPAAPVLAKGHHNDHGKKEWRDRDRDEGCYFRGDDVRFIREYYAPRYQRLPPGLAKKYYRTGHLPPGWQKKMRPLPVVVERHLMPLPRPYRRGVIDGAVVVYEPRTQVMIDVVALFGH